MGNLGASVKDEILSSSNDCRTSSSSLPRHGILFVLVFAAVLAGGGFTFSNSILQGMASLWIVSDEIEPADAIVVLGGGAEIRPLAAADLYKRGFARQILLANPRESAAEKQRAITADSVLNREVLLKLGVPDSAIILFGDGVTNTYEEARALLGWAKSTGAKRIIVPTGLFATRRLRWILGKELAPSGIHFSVQAVSSPRYTVNDWWTDNEGLITFGKEVIKYLYYRLRY